MGMICILNVCAIQGFSHSSSVSQGVIRITIVFFKIRSNSYYTSAQDELIQNAGGHIHHSTCKKKTCTITIKGDPSGAWIGHSDYVEWRYIVSHSSCGAGSYSGSINYSTGSTAPAYDGVTLMQITHTYWNCGY